MYFWKDNPDNNVKSFQHELFQRTESKGQRNLLGLQKESTFLDDFSMSDLMSIELMKIDTKVRKGKFRSIDCAHRKEKGS